MKLFIILFVVSLCLAFGDAQDPTKPADGQKANIDKYMSDCITQENTTKEAVQSMRNGQYSNADQNLKCFAKCFLEKKGYLSNGQPQESVMSSELSPIVGADKFPAIMKQCNTLKGRDDCDNAFQLFECYFKQNVAII